MGGPSESPVFHQSAQKSQVFASFRRLENRHPLTQHTQAWGGPLEGGWLYSILCDMSMGGDPHRGGGWLCSILCDMSILAPPPPPPLPFHQVQA